MSCAFCGGMAEDNYSVHTSAEEMDHGGHDEVDLCDACGGEEYPLLGQIWHAIANRYHVRLTSAKEVSIICATCKIPCILMNTTTRILWRCTRCRRDIVIDHFEDMAVGCREVQTTMQYQPRICRPHAKWAF